MTGDLAVPSVTLADITPAKKPVTRIHPTNSNHNSSWDDKSYNSKSDFKTDEVGEEESNVNKNEQTLEELEGEEVSNLIEDLRESNWIQHLLQQNQLHMTGLMNTSGKIWLWISLAEPSAHPIQVQVGHNGMHLELGVVMQEFFLSCMWLIEFALSKTNMDARVGANHDRVTAFAKAVDELKAQSEYEENIVYQHV